MSKMFLTATAKFLTLLLFCGLGTVLAQSDAQGSISIFTASQPTPNFLAHAARTGDGQAIYLMMHCRLVNLTDTFEFAPDLAKSYEVSEDGKVYTFYLNEDARWHDGTPVTAEDVEFSWVAYATPEEVTESRIRPPVYTSVVGGEAVQESASVSTGYADTAKYEGIEVLNDHTVRFTLTETNPLWLSNIAQYPNGWLLPKHVLGDVPWAEWPQHPVSMTDPVGCGPYEFVERVEGQYVELEAFPDYYLGAPNLERIFVKSWLTTEVAAAQLESGELDLVLSLELEDAKRLAENPDIEILTVPASNAYQLSINTDFVQDPRVRQAMEYALDRQGINEFVFDGQGKVVECCLLTDWAVPEDQEIREYNPERARELLAEAGWDSSQTLDILYPVGYRYSDVLLPIIQQQLAEVGIQVELRPEENTAHRESLIAKHDWDIWFNQSANMLPDPGSFTLWECRPEPQSGWRFCNDRLNDLYEQGRSTLDQSERQEIYQEIQRIFYEENPAVNIVLPPSIVGLRERLEGFKPTALMFDAFWNVHEWTIAE